jgi:hypothetical protein
MNICFHCRNLQHMLVIKNSLLRPQFDATAFVFSRPKEAEKGEQLYEHGSLSAGFLCSPALLLSYWPALRYYCRPFTQHDRMSTIQRAPTHQVVQICYQELRSKLPSTNYVVFLDRSITATIEYGTKYGESRLLQPARPSKQRL